MFPPSNTTSGLTGHCLWNATEVRLNGEQPAVRSQGRPAAVADFARIDRFPFRIGANGERVPGLSWVLDRL